MSPLVTGSLAFDYLLHVNGKFSNRLPAAQDDATAGENTFAAAYLAPQLTRVFGGCAGNISYALTLLGEKPQMLATAGSDFTPYADYLHALGISTEHVQILPDFYTAQAYMVTDEGNNQIIVFHPGATAEAHRQDIAALPPPPLAIVAPNGKDAIMRHCRTLAAQNTPFIFDPGQAIGSLSAAEMTECLQLAPYAIFNASEFEYFSKTTQMSLADARAQTDVLFITHSEQGSEAYAHGEKFSAACVHLGETRDPTGCGDAFRAGLMYGMLRNWDWQPLLEFAAVIAAVKATHNGGQGYALSLQQVQEQYQQTFGRALPQTA